MSGCTVLALSRSPGTAGRRRVRAAGEESRCVHGRCHERPVVGAGLEADAVLELRAGHEQAVAATKTYSNQIAALGCSPRTLPAGREFVAGCAGVAEAMPAFISLARGAHRQCCQAIRVRGPNVRRRPRREFATAREIALKLLETCRIAAEPLTATDAAHGPIAALDSLFPVWAIASDDPTLPAVVEAVERARAARRDDRRERQRRDVDPFRRLCPREPRTSLPLLAPAALGRARDSSLPGRSRARAASIPTPRAASKVTLAR